MTRTITANLEFTGMSDYWSGNGRRWDDDAACVFAFYGATTTLATLIDELAADDSGDFEGKADWEDVTDAEIKAAILATLTDEGRKDYESGGLAWCAREYGETNGHDYESDIADEDRMCDCCGDSAEGGESPMVCFLLEIEDDTPRLRCDQCEAAMINGVFCHEIGCPNRSKVWIDGEWITPETSEDEDDDAGDYEGATDEDDEDDEEVKS